jgi:hypothetical protein
MPSELRVEPWCLNRQKSKCLEFLHPYDTLKWERIRWKSKYLFELGNYESGMQDPDPMARERGEFFMHLNPLPLERVIKVLQ